MSTKWVLLGKCFLKYRGNATGDGGLFRFLRAEDVPPERREFTTHITLAHADGIETDPTGLKMKGRVAPPLHSSQRLNACLASSSFCDDRQPIQPARSRT